MSDLLDIKKHIYNKKITILYLTFFQRVVRYTDMHRKLLDIR